MTRFQAPFVAFVVFIVFVVMAVIPAPLSAQTVDPATAVPFNMQINPVLLPVVSGLMAASPAFAAQCARIADARYVRVMINPVMSSSTTSRGSARTTMRRFASGALIAEVDMPVPLTNTEYAELFGHELEHILEQIDRVDLEAMAAARDGATRLADGAFETTRARRAGHLIAGQIEQHTRDTTDSVPATVDPVSAALAPAAGSLAPTAGSLAPTAGSLERGRQQSPSAGAPASWPATPAPAPRAAPPAIGPAAAAVRQQ